MLSGVPQPPSAAACSSEPPTACTELLLRPTLPAPSRPVLPGALLLQAYPTAHRRQQLPANKQPAPCPTIWTGRAPGLPPRTGGAPIDTSIPRRHGQAVVLPHAMSDPMSASLLRKKFSDEPDHGSAPKGPCTVWMQPQGMQERLHLWHFRHLPMSLSCCKAFLNCFDQTTQLCLMLL